MRISRILLFFLLCFISFKSFSQRVDSKVSSIDSLIGYIQTNEDNRSLYETIFTDGLVTKKTLGLFKSRKGSGGYSEQYTIQDSLLVKLWTGKRIFLNQQQTVSHNTMEYYIFENENLCYYKEKKFYEEKNGVDSLLYEITYYIDNENVLLFDSKGSFEKESTDYLTQILKTASKKIKYKNALIKW